MILQSTSQRICPLLEQAQAGAMHAEIQPPSQRTGAACKSAKGKSPTCLKRLEVPREQRNSPGIAQISHPRQHEKFREELWLSSSCTHTHTHIYAFFLYVYLYMYTHTQFRWGKKQTEQNGNPINRTLGVARCFVGGNGFSDYLARDDDNQLFGYFLSAEMLF